MTLLADYMLRLPESSALAAEYTPKGMGTQAVQTGCAMSLAGRSVGSAWERVLRRPRSRLWV